ncbi:SGNH/GDSL hydrolase family protein [Curtobacterium sp. MCBA15_004]|uniref:SGNH/GDSL hydrolase family protein n=1 Tax=unclassified Curtobacterium TaxID=257496 RepID=UPI000A998246|nr:SGNH/GDSL hydrolase family protein [Curtobacterium sp. MCBA15_004]WIA96284.1 SGNH/GDSL hydrolase family protein [Curtobacterium sp. MCBA15_004]
MHTKFAVVGDSFAEGVGDDWSDGSPRGWADLVAGGLSAATDEQVTYANLAVRGKLLTPILDEQLPAALRLAPDLLSISGGNNDIIRPKVSIAANARRIAAGLDAAVAAGADVLFVTVADMTQHLPLGRLIRRRGDEYADHIRSWADRPHVTVVDNWSDPVFHDIALWAPDRLHLNTLGHRRVAANVLAALGVDVPDWDDTTTLAARASTIEHLRVHVLPWVGRRLTGRSSGDGREPKSATLGPVRR